MQVIDATSEVEGSAAPAMSRALAPVSKAKGAAAVHGVAREHLTFRLGAEEYGLDILRVQEIRSYEQPTRIANTPDFLRGVVNLRGVIVPIVDLRLKLACQAEFNEIGRAHV